MTFNFMDNVKTKFYRLCLVILVILTFSISATAEYFPARWGNDDILMIQDFYTDLAIRLYLIDNAKESIDIVTHIHTPGPYGAPLAVALRNAMKRGVRVRYLYEKMANIASGDAFDKTMRLLTDKDLPNSGSEIMINRIFERIRSPFALNELFHQKIFVVDKGTQDEVIVSGGRNHDDTSVRNVDLSYVIRRIDPSKPYIGDDIKTHFEQIWTLANRYFSLEKPMKLKKSDRDLISRTESQPLTFNLSPENQDLLNTAKNPLSTKGPLKPFQFRPQHSRLVTNDVLKNIVERKEAKKRNLPIDTRKVDDITEYLASLMEDSTKLELSAYLLIMPGRLHEALETFISKGGDLKVYTNGKDSYKTVLPVFNLGKVAAGYNYEVYKKLLELNPNANIELNEVHPKLAKENNNEAAFTHRKMLLLETKNLQGEIKKMTWSGSYNFTVGSATKVDEMGILFADTRMHQYLSDMSAKENQIINVSVPADVACKACKQQKIIRKLCKPLFEAVF